MSESANPKSAGSTATRTRTSSKLASSGSGTRRSAAVADKPLIAKTSISTAPYVLNGARPPRLPVSEDSPPSTGSYLLDSFIANAAGNPVYIPNPHIVGDRLSASQPFRNFTLTPPNAKATRQQRTSDRQPKSDAQATSPGAINDQKSAAEERHTQRNGRSSSPPSNAQQSSPQQSSARYDKRDRQVSERSQPIKNNGKPKSAVTRPSPQPTHRPTHQPTHQRVEPAAPASRQPSARQPDKPPVGPPTESPAKPPANLPANPAARLPKKPASKAFSKQTLNPPVRQPAVKPIGRPVAPPPVPVPDSGGNKVYGGAAYKQLQARAAAGGLVDLEDTLLFGGAENKDSPLSIGNTPPGAEANSLVVLEYLMTLPSDFKLTKPEGTRAILDDFSWLERPSLIRSQAVINARKFEVVDKPEPMTQALQPPNEQPGKDERAELEMLHRKIEQMNQRIEYLSDRLASLRSDPA